MLLSILLSVVFLTTVMAVIVVSILNKELIKEEMSQRNATEAKICQIYQKGEYKNVDIDLFQKESVSVAFNIKLIA